MFLSPINTDEKLLNNINELYKNIWDHPIKERLLKHSSYKGFRGCVMFSDDEELIGFSYGYCSSPGQYYHDLLSKEFEANQYEIWLKDGFEVVELAVKPTYRNKGYGKLLVNKLLEGVTNKTAVLTTQAENKQARNLYEKLGWNVITESFIPIIDKDSYVIMGKILR